MNDNGVEDVSSNFEEIPCPLCESHSNRNFIEVRDRLKTEVPWTGNKPREKDFQIVACSSCGFLFLNPRPVPERLQYYYQTGDYEPHRSSGGALISRIFRLVRIYTLRWKAARVTVGIEPGNLLDVGCGTGEFLGYVKKLGWNVTGLENDQRAAESAKLKGGEILVGDPARLPLSEQEYNLITMWHSIEHLSDLNAALDKIVASLKCPGKIAIAVPNPGSFDAEFYQERWAAWDAPRHLYHFRKRDLINLLERRGLTLNAIHRMPLDPFYHSLLSELSWISGALGYIKAVRGLLIGLLSFLKGSDRNRASSLLYIFDKT